MSADTSSSTLAWNSGAIRAVTFDVGGTLLEPWPSVGHVYGEVAADRGFGSADVARLNRQFAAAWKRRGGFDYSRDAWLELVEQSFAGLCSAEQCRAFFPELYDRFKTRAAWRLFPDVLPALEQLRRGGFALAVISNWDERLRDLLREFALERFFAAVLISVELGHQKPEPAIFDAAARALKLNAASILHIGDSLREDLEGARQAGFSAVLVDRSGSVEGKAGRVRSLAEAVHSLAAAE